MPIFVFNVCRPIFMFFVLRIMQMSSRIGVGNGQLGLEPHFFVVGLRNDGAPTYAPILGISARVQHDQQQRRSTVSIL